MNDQYHFLPPITCSFWNGFRIKNLPQSTQSLPTQGITLKTTKQRNVLFDTEGAGWKITNGKHTVGLPSATYKNVNPPSSLLIQTTKNCNLFCSYCYQKDSKDNKLLAIDVLNDYLNNICKNDHKAPSSFLITGGEPFLYPELVLKIINIIQRFVISDYSITIETNGTLLTNDIIKNFDPKNIGFALSLDGLPNSYIEKRRIYRNKKSSLTKAFNALKLLVSAGFSLLVNTTVDETNVELLPKFHFSLKKLGVSRVRYQKIITQSCHQTHPFLQQDFEKNLLKLFSADVCAWLNDDFYCENPFGYILDRLTLQASPLCLPCSAGKNIQAFLSNSKLLPCDAYEGMSINEMQKCSGICQSCYFSNLCGSGCIGTEKNCLLKKNFFYTFDFIFESALTIKNRGQSKLKFLTVT